MVRCFNSEQETRMTDTIEFQGENYTEESLKAMGVEELLTLRNKVAEQLGVQAIKGFKDAQQGADSSWKALSKLQAKRAKPEEKAEKAKAKKEAKPKEPRPTPKSAAPQKVENPTKAMFRRIRKIAAHPGTGYRIARWENYKDGMTLLDCAEGDNMTPLDVHYYVVYKLMELVEPTQEEYEREYAEWCKKNGVENRLEAKKKADEAKKQKADEAKADAEKADA
jgi:hypothetical protein